MPDHTFLADLVLTYAIALVLVVGLARVRVPAIVTMMLAGVVAGPSGLRVIGTAEEVETLAELGIVLLLFTVGLDFSLAAVKQIWRTILVAGTLQIVVTAAVVAGLAMLIVDALAAAGDLHRPVRGAVEHRDRAQRAGRAERAVGAARTADRRHPPAAGPGHRRAAAARADSVGPDAAVGGAAGAGLARSSPSLPSPR